MTELVHDYCVAEGIPAQSETERMVAAFSAGATWKDLAASFHRGLRTCKAMMIDAGAWERGTPTPRAIQQQHRWVRARAEAERLGRQTNWSVRAIADKVGVSHQFVSAWFHDVGISTKGRKRRVQMAAQRRKQGLPRCVRCAIRTDKGEQSLTVAKEHHVCDQCVLDIRAGRLCRSEELDAKVIGAIRSAVIPRQELAAVAVRMAKENQVPEDGHVNLGRFTQTRKADTSLGDGLTHNVA